LEGNDNEEPHVVVPAVHKPDARADVLVEEDVLTLREHVHGQQQIQEREDADGRRATDKGEDDDDAEKVSKVRELDLGKEAPNKN